MSYEIFVTCNQNIKYIIKLERYKCVYKKFKGQNFAFLQQLSARLPKITILVAKQLILHMHEMFKNCVTSWAIV